MGNIFCERKRVFFVQILQMDITVLIFGSLWWQPRNLQRHICSLLFGSFHPTNTTTTVPHLYPRNARIYGRKKVVFFCVCQGANSCCKQINAILSPGLFNGVATYGYYCVLITKRIMYTIAQFTDASSMERADKLTTQPHRKEVKRFSR